MSQMTQMYITKYKLSMLQNFGTIWPNDHAIKLRERH